MNGGSTEQGKPQGREGRARLSVLLLSFGDEVVLEQSLVTVSDVVFALGAQLVIVHQDASAVGRERVQRLAQQHRCAVAFADEGADRAAMSREAMRYVSGDILVVRDAAAVHDASWLAGVARAHGLDVDGEIDHPLTVTEITDERVVVGARPVSRPVHPARRRSDAASEPLA